MKRIYSIALTIALICALLVTATFVAATTGNEVTVTAENVSVCQPGTVEVDVVLSNNTGFNVFSIEIASSSENLKLVGYESGLIPAVMGTDSDNAAIRNNKGKVNWMTMQTITENGVLFTLKFEVLAAGDYQVSLDVKNLVIGDSSIDVNVVNGTVSIGHDLQPVAGQPATCNGIGWEAYEQCSRCDYNTKVVIGALGHDLQPVEGQPATCTDPGWEAYEQCSRCDYNTKVVIPATGHNHVAVVTPATCTEGGYTTHTCACGDSYVDNKTNALGHDMSELLEHVDATEEAEGHNLWGCSRCDYTETEILPKLDHQHDYTRTEVVTAPTCTEQGYTTVTITCRCGDSQTEVVNYVAALGHTWGEWVETQAPTVDEAGEETRTCSVCSETETRQTYHEHEYVPVVTPNGCTTQGYTTWTCSCGHSYVDSYVAATGHDMEDWRVHTKPTCAAEGQERRYCKNCGDYYHYRAIEKLEHEMGEWYTAIEATCTEAGEERRDCANCDHFETAEIPVIGHAYEAVVTDPTCTENGYTTYTCSACGDSYVEDIPATGHFYEGVVTAPTCVDEGYTTYTCSVCGDTYVADYVAADGHGYEAVVTEPTCTEGGYTTYTCSVCGDSYVADQVDALGHTYEAVVTDPTCFEEGYTTYTCSVCGDTYVADYTDPSGHGYEAVVTAPTCTEGGYTTYTCASCGDSYIADETEALGHNYVVTETTAEYIVYTCTGCGDTYSEATNPPTGETISGLITLAVVSMVGLVCLTTKKREE